MSAIRASFSRLVSEYGSLPFDTTYLLNWWVTTLSDIWSTNMVLTRVKLLALSSILILTSAIDPWPHIVMEGKSSSDIGFAVVSRDVRIGLSCHCK